MAVILFRRCATCELRRSYLRHDKHFSDRCNFDKSNRLIRCLRFCCLVLNWMMKIWNIASSHPLTLGQFGFRHLFFFCTFPTERVWNLFTYSFQLFHWCFFSFLKIISCVKIIFTMDLCLSYFFVDYWIIN